MVEELEDHRECKLVFLESFYNLFTQPYWQRAWIVQEIANNRNATLFIYGNKSLSRSILRLVAEFCQIHTLGADIGARFTEAETVLNLNNGPTSKQTCESLLSLIRHAKSTDPRDKVYGFLGLLEDKIVARITPDYDLTVLDVYTEFAISLFRSNQSLAIILVWCNPCLKDHWPSWVPDWREPFNRKYGETFTKRGLK